MRFSGSLCGSFFPKQTATTHALSHFALDHFSRLEMSDCRALFLRPALQHIARSLSLPLSRICTPEATLFPCGAMGTLTMALCPQAQIVLTLAMEIGQFHQRARAIKEIDQKIRPQREAEHRQIAFIHPRTQRIHLFRSKNCALSAMMTSAPPALSKASQIFPLGRMIGALRLKPMHKQIVPRRSDRRSKA